MSRTEDDARAGASTASASAGRGDVAADVADSPSDQDGEVLPTSDWSVDDDDPANIDPLLTGSARRPSAPDATQATGEVPVVKSSPKNTNDRVAAREERTTSSATAHVGDSPTERVTAERRPTERTPVQSTQAEATPTERRPTERTPVQSTQAEATPTERRVTEWIKADRRPTEPVPAQRKEPEPTPAERRPTEARHQDPRAWDVEDDLGPWQSHAEVVGSAPPALYPAEDQAHDDHPGRKVVRRTTRILRHVDPWSTFKVGLLFSLVGYLVTMTSGVLLWNVAARTGTLDNVERWFTQFGWETFELDGSSIFTNSAIAGLFLAVGATGAMVMFATIFNLASDAIGGIRMTVLEEQRVRHFDDDMYGHVDPSYGIEIDARDDWDLGD